MLKGPGESNEIYYCLYILTALTRMPGGFDGSVEKALACSSVRRLTPIFDT